MQQLRIPAALCLILVFQTHVPLTAQDTSVRPGINDTFRDPDPKQFTERFEVESREVFAKRKEIVAALELKPNETIADIGAGTGLFTRLFAAAVPEGRVMAVDIAQKFLDHIQATCRAAGLANVVTLQCQPDNTLLPPESIDVAFICDTYHHFEFPHKTMTSLWKGLRPGGRVIVIDFKRIEGESTAWTMEHVRAGQETFEAEIIAAGFQKVGEKKDLLKENYLVVFQKPRATAVKELVYPIIANHGGVLPRPSALQQPRAGSQAIIDITSDFKPTEVNKGLDRTARLLNLFGSTPLSADQIKIAAVLHGEATKAVLSNAAYRTRYQEELNPNLPLIQALQKAGVEVFVCGQALNYKGFQDTEVAAGIPIAAAALTVIINKQLDGYAYVPIH